MHRMLAVLGGIAAGAERRPTFIPAVWAAAAALARGKGAFAAATRGG
jgi:hypothetical protein